MASMKAFGKLDGIGWQFVEVAPSSASGKSLLVNADGSVVSVQPDGRIESRPHGTDGAYEQCVITGALVVFSGTGQPFVFGIAGA